MSALEVINLWMSCFERQDITFCDVEKIKGNSKTARVLREVFKKDHWKVMYGKGHMTVLGIKKIQEIKRNI